MLKFDEVTKEFEDGNHTIEAVNRHLYLLKKVNS